MRAAVIFLVASLALSSGKTRADDSPQAWEFIGITQAAATVDVRGRATGYVTHVAVKGGDAVKKGDLLLEVDPQPYRLALDAAMARVKEAEARLSMARIKAANAKALHDKKVLGPDELALSAGVYEEAEAALVGAKVEAQRAELTLSWTKVTAPFDGRVNRIRVTEGDLVAADQTPLMTILFMDRLHIVFNVPERLLLQLHRDGFSDPSKLSVAVGFAGDEGFSQTVKLDLIDSVVNPQTASVQFQATLPNPKGMLLPGMSARVRLTPVPQ